MVYIGVDPGSKGMYSVIKEDSVVIKPLEFETFAEDMHSMMDEKRICCLEKVGARPGQGTVSMFNFGKNFGMILGVLISSKTPFELVTPQKWKKEFSITGDKNTSIEVCQRLFPDVNLYRSDRCKKKDDNMAESLLMAEYARRKF